ncbi:hypothetical protein AT15_09615 [Kosmotoga arenicorallina S304]|uniref:Na+/H+ antiporter MnhB subunit-related protein domain-containing protein n=1 Tax=Kosmotoga arenicorallina S304 TaxID=1453497 RepID=A0A176K0X0_9BACT|nr:MnhB domain-containing protein [Kosmotoga arenicorallina]OAA30677.1 hypothetical protein AT15_09615 [Kosmotoga arenicorallina S304]
MAERHSGMTLIVKTITRFTVWLILLYGIFLMIHGHLTPGGGFVGGLVVALSLIHIRLAFGKRSPTGVPGKALLHRLDSTGALLFLAVGIAAFFAGLPFLSNFLPKGRLFDLFSAGTIPILNFAIMLKVGAAIFLVFVALNLYEHGKNTEVNESKNEKKEEE